MAFIFSGLVKKENDFPCIRYQYLYFNQRLIPLKYSILLFPK